MTNQGMTAIDKMTEMLKMAETLSSNRLAQAATKKQITELTSELSKLEDQFGRRFGTLESKAAQMFGPQFAAFPIEQKLALIRWMGELATANYALDAALTGSLSVL